MKKTILIVFLIINALITKSQTTIELDNGGLLFASLNTNTTYYKPELKLTKVKPLYYRDYNTGLKTGPALLLGGATFISAGLLTRSSTFNGKGIHFSGKNACIVSGTIIFVSGIVITIGGG